MSRASAPAPRPMARWLYWAVLAVVALIPGQLAYAVHPRHGPFVAYVDLALAAVGIVWGLGAIRSGRWRHLPWPPREVWVLLVVVALSGLQAQSLRAAAVEVLQVGLYFVVGYTLLADAMGDPRRQRTAMLVLLAATSAAIAYAAWQVAAGQAGVGEGSGVAATFQSRAAYGAFMAIVLPLWYGLLLRSERPWERIWALGALITAGLTILAPGSLPALALTLAAVSVAADRGARRWLGAGAVVAAATVMMTLVPAQRGALHEFLNPYETGQAFKAMPGEGEGRPVVKKRWVELVPSFVMMAENPLLGVGAGSYQLSIGRAEYYGFLPNVRKSEADTGSLYAVAAGSMGFIGLIAWLAVMGHFLARAWALTRRRSGREQAAWALGALGLALAVPLTNLLSSTFVRGTSLAWAMGYALIAVLGSTAMEASDGGAGKDGP